MHDREWQEETDRRIDFAFDELERAIHRIRKEAGLSMVEIYGVIEVIKAKHIEQALAGQSSI